VIGLPRRFDCLEKHFIPNLLAIIMAADEYYDGIGQVLSYVLSAEDFIYSQRQSDSGKHFLIERDGTLLDFYAQPNNRYFILMYQFSLTQKIIEAYNQDNQILQEHMERFEIEDTQVSDKYLDQEVALHRIQDVGENANSTEITKIYVELPRNPIADRDRMSRDLKGPT
jgi:hypothetical protein